MQGLVQNLTPPKYQPQRIPQVTSKGTQLNHQSSMRLRQRISSPKFKTNQSLSNTKSQRNLLKKSSSTTKEKIQIKQMRDFGQVARRKEDESPEKFSNRAVQTEKSTDVKKIYENGVIKFPSSSVLLAINSFRKKQRLMRQQDRGDSLTRSPSPNNEDLSERVKELGRLFCKSYKKRQVTLFRLIVILSKKIFILFKKIFVLFKKILVVFKKRLI